MTETYSGRTDDVTLDLGDGLEAESIDGLEELAEETQGAWPKGWYKAEVIEGFQTRKGKTIQTGDSVSKDGASRNLKLCLRVVNGVQERNMIASFNYRASDFSPERIAFVKEKRKEHEGVSGRWSDTDAQRSSLALAFIGGLTKALGFSPKIANGGLVAGIYVGSKVDVYLGVDKKGFNDARNFAKAGDKTAS